MQLHGEKLFQKAAFVAEAAQDRVAKAFESGRHIEDKHFAVLGRGPARFRIRNVKTEPKITQGGLVEENRNALVMGMVGDALAKQVASAFEKYGFAGFHHDFLVGKAKHLRSFGYENEGVFRYEYIARLLFDALMVLSEVELASLKEAAIRRIGEIAWDSEQVRCR